MLGIPLSDIPLLKVENIALERHDSLLFSSASLELVVGEAVHIEGPNGSGKTTLFQLLAGLLQPSEGSIQYCGQSIETCRYDYHGNLLFIGHQSAIKDRLTTKENLRWLSPVKTTSGQISHALERVGLANYEDVQCHQLSAGQQRRVALARLITTDAKLWFLDEPFAALDKQGIDLVETLMQSHLQRGGAVLFSSHQDLAKISARKYSMISARSLNE